MCPLSIHQFIEISICALENKINSNISMSSDPWKSVRQQVFPCTAAETIGRTKLPSSVWEKKQIQGFSLWNTNHARRVPTFKSMFRWKKNYIKTYKHTLILCDYSKIDIRFSEEI